MSEQSCLNCRWLSDPGSIQVWHLCLFPVRQKLPACVGYAMGAIDIKYPYRDCPTWEPRTAEDTQL